MKLNVKDRIAFPYLLPQTHNMVTMLAVRDIFKKIRLTQDEEKRIKLVVAEGRVSWDLKENFEIDISFNNLEINLLRDQVNIMDKKKEVSEDVLDICLKVKDEK